MTFATLPVGAAVFVDSNTLVYHFAPDPVYGTACSDLLIRIKRQEVQGFTSTHIVAEMGHHLLMTLEAVKTYSWPMAGIVQRPRSNPADVKKLTAFRQAIREIPVFNLTILPISPLFLIRERQSAKRPVC